jgi:hypothetical protein
MTFRTIALAASAAIAFSALATSAFASGSVTGTANASVTVLSPVTVTKTQDLAFGQIVRPSNANTNTVVLDSNNNVTVSGSGNGSTVASTTTSAKFNITAPAGTTYTTTQTLSFTQTGLTNVAASLPAAQSGTLGTIPAGGVQGLNYGGQFDMNSATTPQAYTGTLSVTVNYN